MDLQRNKFSRGQKEKRKKIHKMKGKKYIYHKKDRKKFLKRMTWSILKCYVFALLHDDITSKQIYCLTLRIMFSTEDTVRPKHYIIIRDSNYMFKYKRQNVPDKIYFGQIMSVLIQVNKL